MFCNSTDSTIAIAGVNLFNTALLSFTPVRKNFSTLVLYRQNVLQILVPPDFFFFFFKLLFFNSFSVCTHVYNLYHVWIESHPLLIDYDTLPYSDFLLVRNIS